MKLSNEIIISRQNKLLVRASSLLQKKYRDEEQAFLIDGFKLFEEAVKFHLEITHVFLSESAKEQYLPLVTELLDKKIYQDTSVIFVSDPCFEKLTKEKSPQGIVTIVKYLDKIKNIIKIYKEEDYILNKEKILILSSLRDPSNIGAILRSASAFGIKTVIMSCDCADVYQSKALRSSMGAVFHTRILFAENLSEIIKDLRACGRRVFAAELSENAVSIDDVSFIGEDIVVIGNEGHGISKEVSSACDKSIFLPISSQTESLNAAVAASIFLWEMRA